MIVGLLVAAGYGRRFDPSGRLAKLEQALDGETVAVRTARALADGCDRVVAVVRPESTALATDLRRAGCEIVLVSGPEGMGTSIACGARHAADWFARDDAPGAVLIQPADMPWLAAATVARIAAEGAGHPIAVPCHAGQDGHPVRFDRALIDELIALRGEQGARRLLARHPVHRLPVDDAGVLRDVDTPADLAPSVGPITPLATSPTPPR